MSIRVRLPNLNFLEHKTIQKKLNRRKSDPIFKTTKKLMKANKINRIKVFDMAPINSTVVKYQSKNIQSLKQNLNKRVMEYKTMHNIKINNKDS